MSFASEIYPQRHNHRRMASRLLAKVETHFTRLVPVPGFGVPNENARTRYEIVSDSGWLADMFALGDYRAEQIQNFTAQRTDKKAVKLLLKAFKRDIPDRYIDYQTIRSFRGSGNSITREEAYRQIRRNAPSGCVKFIFNELPKSGENHRGLHLFGNGITEDMTYNQYYSRLVQWDNLHCFGLIMEISRLNNLLQLGGGNAVGSKWHAASAFVHHQQRIATENNIYKQMAE